MTCASRPDVPLRAGRTILPLLHRALFCWLTLKITLRRLFIANARRTWFSLDSAARLPFHHVPKNTLRPATGLKGKGLARCGRYFQICCSSGLREKIRLVSEKCVGLRRARTLIGSPSLDCFQIMYYSLSFQLRI